MDGNRKFPAFTVFIRITDKLDKNEGYKQGGKEIKGAVLIACNKEIGAGNLS